MSVPSFDKLLAPILEMAGKSDVSIRLAMPVMIEKFKLTPEDQQETISSGSSRLANRCGWAITHLLKAQFLNRKARGIYTISDQGIKFLKHHSGPIKVEHLKQVPAWVEGWKSGAEARKVNPGSGEITPITTETPEEIIESSLATLHENLSDELLNQLSTVDAYRFEKIVLDVLIAMGYGGSRDEAAQVTGKSNDEGIDGIINEDRLGLDVIYVQAKRWKNRVGRQEIQAFVGALAGKQAQKGIFITTSDFAQNAYDYAKSISQKVVLIDGTRLAQLMIDHGVGVSTQRKIEIKRLDSDYFED